MNTVLAFYMGVEDEWLELIVNSLLGPAEGEVYLNF